MANAGTHALDAPHFAPRAARAPRREERLPRALRVALAVIAGAYVLYLLVANVALGTGLLRSGLNTKPDRLRVEYASAWTLWPGTVVTRDFSMRFQDDNVEFLLDLPRATIDVDLFALTKRTFHARSVRAEGASFLFRHKVHSVEGNAARLAAYPRIPGYADPPLHTAPPKPPIPDDQYKLWTIELDDVAASTRELWVMEYRFRGRGSVAGSFRLRPERELHVAPSVLLTEGGAITIGGRDVMIEPHGRVEAEVEPFDVRVPHGIEVLRHLSTRIHLEGKLASVAPLGSVYLEGTPVTIDRGGGTLTVDAHADHGLLQPDTRVSYASSDVVVRTPPLVFTGDAHLEGRVEASAKQHTLTARVTSARVGASPTAAAKPAATPAIVVRTFAAEVGLGNADLASSFDLASLGVSIESARVPDLRALSPLAPKKLHLEGGAVNAALEARYDGGALDGHLGLGLDRVAIATDALRVSASGKAWATASSEDVSKTIALPRLAVELRDVDLRAKDAHGEGMRVAVRADGTTIHTAGPVVAGALHVDAGPGDRVLSLAATLASLPERVGDVGAGTELHAAARGRAQPGLAALELDGVRQGPFGARGTLVSRRGATSGAILLGIGPVNAGLTFRDSHVTVTPFVPDDWLDRKSATSR